ncbi:MAG: GNAT family N-acetyltransferase [Spirochaetales bacterium]|nr:GNAT family N-acetyltransferase [Spirochaetales bacterium]
MKIITADRSDLEEILKVQKKAFYPVSFFYNNPDLGPLHTTLDELNEHFNEYTYLKAVEGNLIIGFLRAKRIDDSCKIESVSVDPEWQKRGIGSQLIKAIEAIFRDVDNYELLTGLKTPGNVTFYSKMNYQIKERIPGTRTIPELVLMQKKSGYKNA